jgi:hypothetical protein
VRACYDEDGIQSILYSWVVKVGSAMHVQQRIVKGTAAICDLALALMRTLGDGKQGQVREQALVNGVRRGTKWEKVSVW